MIGRGKREIEGGDRRQWQSGGMEGRRIWKWRRCSDGRRRKEAKWRKEAVDVSERETGREGAAERYDLPHAITAAEGVV